MPRRICPLCGQLGRKLADIIEEFSVVDYYRCEPCGHVWWRDKFDPDAPAIPVTPGPDHARGKHDPLEGTRFRPTSKSD